MAEVWVCKEVFRHYFTLVRAKFQCIESGHLDETTNEKRYTSENLFFFPRLKVAELQTLN